MYHPLDGLTAELTAFNSFAELLDSHPSYRPTIMPRDMRHVDLADAFDAAARDRGQSRRAYRGGAGSPSNVAPKSPEGYLSIRFAGVPAGSGLYSDWLRAIHAINGEHKGGDQIIGTPTSTRARHDGSYVEEYPEFRVILRHTAWGNGENSGTIQAKDADAEYLLRVAAAQVLGRDIPVATKGE